MPMAEEDPRPTRSEARSFGLLLAAVFVLLGGVVGWQLASLRVFAVMGGIGGALAALYYAIPPLRVPLFRGWRALTMPLGRVISTTILAAVYFLALTPLAWLLRIFRRDPLRQRLDPSAESYWDAYDPGGDLDRYFRQS